MQRWCLISNCMFTAGQYSGSAGRSVTSQFQGLDYALNDLRYVVRVYCRSPKWHSVMLIWHLQTVWCVCKCPGILSRVCWCPRWALCGPPWWLEDGYLAVIRSVVSRFKNPLQKKYVTKVYNDSDMDNDTYSLMLFFFWIPHKNFITLQNKYLIHTYFHRPFLNVNKYGHDMICCDCKVCTRQRNTPLKQHHVRSVNV